MMAREVSWRRQQKGAAGNTSRDSIFPRLEQLAAVVDDMVLDHNWHARTHARPSNTQRAGPVHCLRQQHRCAPPGDSRAGPPRHPGARTPCFNATARTPPEPRSLRCARDRSPGMAAFQESRSVCRAVLQQSYVESVCVNGCAIAGFPVRVDGALSLAQPSLACIMSCDRDHGEPIRGCTDALAKRDGVKRQTGREMGGPRASAGATRVGMRATWPAPNGEAAKHRLRRTLQHVGSTFLLCGTCSTTTCRRPPKATLTAGSFFRPLSCTHACTAPAPSADVSPPPPLLGRQWARGAPARRRHGLLRPAGGST